MPTDDDDAVAATIAPPDLAADVTVAAGGLTPASITKPVVRAGPTSSAKRPPTAPALDPTDAPELPTVEPALYDTADEIARGGMGRIVSATDPRPRAGDAVPPRGADHRAAPAPGDRAGLRGGPVAGRRAVLRDEAGRRQ